MNPWTQDAKIARLLGLLADAGEAGLEIKETVPGNGGVRERDMELLVKRGQAEWIVRGERARICN